VQTGETYWTRETVDVLAGAEDVNADYVDREEGQEEEC